MFKVMITEDDPMVAMINEQYITRSKDFQVVKKCGNGAEALEYLKDNPVDLLIMDVYMPVMDGMETLKKIRELDIPVSVILVTAANDLPTFETARRLGAVDYLVKPFVYERFQQALDRFTVNAGILKEGHSLNQSSIDRIVGVSSHTSEALPKGIQEITRQAVIRCLADFDDWLTGDEISEKTGLSSVTVRRYMNYLVQSGDADGKMNYETGGRPCMMYRLGKK